MAAIAFFTCLALNPISSSGAAAGGGGGEGERGLLAADSKPNIPLTPAEKKDQIKQVIFYTSIVLG